MKLTVFLLPLIAALAIAMLVEVVPASSSTQPPSAPTLISPTNAAKITTTSVVFEWELDPDATKYWLEVNTDPNWNSGTTLYYGYASATSQMVTGFPCNGLTYYWRVWAGNSNGWSAPSDRYFISSAVPPPAAPSLIFPDVDATVGGKSIQFQWEASSGATKYWLEVNTDSGWGSGTRLFYGYALGTSQVVSGFPNSPLIGTTFYWRVWAGSSWGWSTPSIRTFTNQGPPPPTPPVLTYPDNGDTITGPSISFQWQASSGATKYWLEVNRDLNWSADTRFYYNYGDTSTCSKTVTGFPLDGTTYYWRVWAGNGQGWSNPSSGWSFDMLSPPVAPTLNYPGNGAADVPYQSITLTWTAPQWATKYWLEVNTDSNWGTTTRFFYNYGDAATASKTLTNLSPSTTYYWRAWAGNAAGWSPVSPDQSFTTSPPAIPLKPALSLPADGSNVPGTSITFEWSASAGASKYWLEVNTDSNWGSGTRFYYGYGDIATHSKTVTGFPNIGTTYYWCAWAGNATGWSAPTDGWSVINGSGPPLAPSLISPGNGTIVSGPSITYQWNASAAAEKYWLLVSTSPDIYGTSAYKHSSNVGNLTQYMDTGYPNNGTIYYWWVWSGNGAGWSSTSQVLANGQNFINGSPMPTSTPAVTPTNGVTPTPTPEVTPPLPPPLSPTPTPTPTLTPTATPVEPLPPHPTTTPIPTPSPTPVEPPPTDTPTPTPSPTPVGPPSPTNTPTPTPTPTPLGPPPSPTNTPTPIPTLTPLVPPPSPTNTVTPTPMPSSTYAPPSGGGGGGILTPSTPTPVTTTPTPTPPPPLSPTPIPTLIPFAVSISVTAPSNSIEVGDTLQLAATATYSDGSTDDVTGNVTWASSDDAIAVVSPSGLVTGVGEGTAQIAATLEGITGTFEVMVSPVPIATSTATPSPTPQTGVATVPWFMIAGIITAALVLSLVCLLLWRRLFWREDNDY